MLAAGWDLRTWVDPLFFAACLFTAGIWVAVGIYKLCHYEIIIGTIRRHHIPLPALAYWISVLAEFVGALLVVTQWSVWGGALIWLLFLLITTPIFHGKIWKDGDINYPQYTHLFKNVSIAGGLLALMALDFAHASVAESPVVPMASEMTK